MHELPRDPRQEVRARARSLSPLYTHTRELRVKAYLTSLYWAPTLYFAWANGSFSSVKQVGGALIYYLDRRHSSDATEVLAFPDGFRMLTGDPFKRSYDGSQTAQAIGWNCLGGAQPTRKPELPSGNCPNGLRAEIRFPSCWNGVELDTDDHHSHVAYSDGESGPCPAAFPKRIETLFYEILWDVDAFEQHRPQALDPDSPFVLSDGDASGGYSLHGDFINGWDHDVLQEAIRTCTYDSGVIEECKIFDLYPSGHECHTVRPHPCFLTHVGADGGGTSRLRTLTRLCWALSTSSRATTR